MHVLTSLIQTKEVTMKNLKNWLTPTDFEEEYSISKSTQAKYRMKKMVPFSKCGKFIRYNRDLIDQWLTDHNVT